jgi:hypothetical protein
MRHSCRGRECGPESDSDRDSVPALSTLRSVIKMTRQIGQMRSDFAAIDTADGCHERGPPAW